jgi:hypothetical protein
MGERRRAQNPPPEAPFQNADSLSKDEQKPPAKARDKDTQKEAMVRNHRLAKLATVFDDQLIEAETAFDDGYGRLARLFKLAHGAPRFDDFEKDAMSVENDAHGLAVLNLMRRERGLPLRGRDALEKMAQLGDRHVVDDTRPLREFRSLVKVARQAARVRDAAAHVRSLCS